MTLAKVVGSIVTSVRSDKIEGACYLLVKPCDVKGTTGESGLVVLDPLCVAVGEVVLVSQGSSACQTPISRDKPIDAIVVGIVDIVEENNRVVFRK